MCSAIRSSLLTKALALDCEGIQIKINDAKARNVVGRVSLVNEQLQCVYDEYVRPPDGATVNYMTKISGIRPEDLENGSFDLW